MLRGLSTIHAAFAAVGLAAFGPAAGPLGDMLPGTPQAAQAQSFIDPNSGIDFVTIGAVNNPAWTGGGSTNNRGSVGYVYNIGKFEVTTSQWVEFFNAVLDRPSTDRVPHGSIMTNGPTAMPSSTGPMTSAPLVPGRRTSASSIN